MRSKHAILFRLSNKVAQVVFLDQTEIILNSEIRVVTYVNKKQERLNYPLATALESDNAEMVKRLKYTKDVLTQMLAGPGAGAVTSRNKVEQAGTSTTRDPSAGTERMI
jgi:polo-like kinase 1